MAVQRWCGGRATWSAGLCLWLATDALAQSPPVIQRIDPLGVAPGATVPLTIYGSGLSGAQHVLNSAGGPCTLSSGIDQNGAQADRAVFDGAVPADAPLGLQTLRIAAAGGVSAQQLWLVDDLPTLRQSDDNVTAAAAQQIPNLAAVDGVIGNLQRRYFRFEAEAGQRIAIEVYARRLGSKLDPLAVLSRADGRQVASADDTPGLGGDCQLVHQPDQRGDYLLELRDIRYRGGDDYPFRLRIGDFPCVQATYPLAAARGTTTQVEFAGMEAAAVDPVTVHAPADAVVDWQPVVARRRDGRAAALANLLLSDRPEVLEVEPNDTRDAPQSVARDHNLNGRFQAPGDVDCFRYTVDQGERLVFEGQTRAEGTPSDLQLRLLDADGKQVAAADDDGANEGRIDHAFAAAGDYTLEVSDLTRRGGPAYVYRVEVRPFAAGFRLAVEGDALNVPAGGTTVLPLEATRLGYSGEIELLVEGLPAGVKAAPAVIGAGQTQGLVSLSAEADAAFDAGAIRIVGTAAVGGQTLRVTADASEWLREQWSRPAVVPPAARRSIVAQSAPALPIALTAEPVEVVFGRELSGELTIVVHRTAGLDGEVVLATVPEKNALPKEISLELKPIPAGQERVTLKFSGAEKAPLGRFSLVLQGTLKRDKETVTATTPVIGYRLAAPFTLAVEARSEPLAAGASQPLTVRVERNPAFQGAVEIQAEGLPAGVSLPEGTIAADAQTIQLVLSAAADAAVGPITGAKLIAAAVDNGKFKAETPLAGLQIAPPQ